MAITTNENIDRLSIIAGKGALPLQLLAAVRELGGAIQFQTFINRAEIDASGIEVRSIKPTKPIDIVLGIRRFKATHICMIGGVDVSDKDREGVFKLLGGKKDKMKAAGDGSLSKFGRVLELVTGAKLVGVHEIMPELLAGPGHIAGPKPDGKLTKDGQFALETAISAGQIDLGQAVVCSGQRVVGVEDIAGTDALLARIGEFHKQGLVGNGKSRLVLAKAKKPNQPMFADLPTIGPDTVRRAHEAGVRAIFIEAGKTIIAERAQFCALADEFDICVFGCDRQ